MKGIIILAIIGTEKLIVKKVDGRRDELTDGRTDPILHPAIKRVPTLYVPKHASFSPLLDRTRIVVAHVDKRLAVFDSTVGNQAMVFSQSIQKILPGQ